MEEVKLEADPHAAPEEVIADEATAAGAQVLVPAENVFPQTEPVAPGAAPPKADWVNDDFSAAGATTDNWGGESSWA